MLRFICSITLVVFTLCVGAQNPSIQHPGVICCPQDICPSEVIGQINESVPPIFLDDSIQVEFAWFELLIDSSSASGTKWVRITGASGKHFQPTGINNPFGGFFMRAIKEVGSLYYQFSNVITVRELPPTSPECVSSTHSIGVESGSVQLFPNPASDHIIFKRGASTAAWTDFRLIRMNSQVVVHQTIADKDFHFQLVADLPAGVYVAQIGFEDGHSEVLRWVKL